MKLLVTGANGFVGTALCEDLLFKGAHEVLAAVRDESKFVVGASSLVVGDIHADTRWEHALNGVDVVVHLAARAHLMRDNAPDPLAAYRAVNAEGTFNLARQAAMAGVRRFVYVSSAKVCGEGQHDVSAAPYTERSVLCPFDAYAVSKYEAEIGLCAIGRATGLEISILRPPLVYGPDVQANFLRLLQSVDRGWPLPLRSIENRRDLVYVGNLASAITICAEHPAAANKTYMLSDGVAVSTPELIRRLAEVMGRPARLLPIPPAWLRLGGALIGKRNAVGKLLGSLMVDSRAIRNELGWQPPYSMQDGLMATVACYQKRTRTE